MGKPRARSVLYRLIEAGQLTRRALLAPLLERGLEPGDDAVLFLLRERRTIAEDELAAGLGLDAAALRQRLARLAGRGLVERHAAAPSVVLTAGGARAAKALAAHWAAVEDALLGGLDRKERKQFRKLLGRLLEQLHA